MASGALSRPLIFIAHSLGGLVCKEAILLSRNHPTKRHRDMFTNLKGIIFMGTPHKGSWIANWSKVPVSALGFVKSTNPTLLDILQTSNEFLESIQVRFLALIREQREAGRQLEVTCFFEELPLLVAGTIVTKQSATFEGYDPISIHANHRDMVKFSSSEENGFKRLVGELDAWQLDIEADIRVREAILSQARETNTTIITEPVVPAKQLICYLPFLKNRIFVERDAVMRKLERFLADSDGRRVAIVGLGGVGKTQIALHLAHLVKSGAGNYEGYSVLWVPALSIQSYAETCALMVGEFRLEHPDAEDPKITIKKFLSSAKAGKWLLIVDNADDMDVLYGSEQQPGGIARFLPDSEEGRILFTTRLQEVAVSVARCHVVELSGMVSGEAKTLLQRSLIQMDQTQDDSLVDRLLLELTYLPLAISQASAYMNKKKVPIEEYLHLLQNTDKDMVELLSDGFRDDTHSDRSRGAVATTWIVSFNQIYETDKDATSLLLFIAYIEPGSIPRTLLPWLGSEQRMTAAIGTLCGYGFLSRREDEGIFDMHSLVHLASRLWIVNEGLEEQSRRVALRNLAQVWSKPLDFLKRYSHFAHTSRTIQMILSVKPITDTLRPLLVVVLHFVKLWLTDPSQLKPGRAAKINPQSLKIRELLERMPEMEEKKASESNQWISSICPIRDIELHELPDTIIMDAFDFSSMEVSVSEDLINLCLEMEGLRIILKRMEQVLAKDGEVRGEKRRDLQKLYERGLSFYEKMEQQIPI